jgi:hypothetical protein
MLIKIGASYLADQIHANHPRQPFLAAKAKRKDADTSRQRGRSWTRYRPSGGQYCPRFCKQGPVTPRRFRASEVTVIKHKLLHTCSRQPFKTDPFGLGLASNPNRLCEAYRSCVRMRRFPPNLLLSNSHLDAFDKV